MAGTFFRGASFDPSGVYSELVDLVDSFDHYALDGSTWHEAHRRVAPDPEAWVPTGEPARPRLHGLAALVRADEHGRTTPVREQLAIPPLLEPNEIGGREALQPPGQRRGTSR